MTTEEIEDDYEVEVDDEGQYEHASPKEQEAMKVQAAKENKTRPVFKITWKRASHLRAVLGFFSHQSYRSENAMFTIDPKTGITAQREATRMELPPLCFDVYDVKKAGPLVVDASSINKRLTALERNRPVTMSRENENKPTMLIEQGDTSIVVPLYSYTKAGKFPEIGQLPIKVIVDRSKLMNAIKVAGGASSYNSDPVYIAITKTGNVKITGKGDETDRAAVDLTRHCDVEFASDAKSITNPYQSKELNDLLGKLKVCSVTLRFNAKKQSPIGIITHVFEESTQFVGVQPYGTVEIYMMAGRSY